MEFAFGDDYISSTAIRDRIDEIELMRDDDAPETWDADEVREHKQLTALLVEIGAPDSRWDEMMLIHENSFTAHIMEEYHELTSNFHEATSRYKYRQIPAGELFSRLPFSCIDWERVAEIEASDYEEITIDGHLYYYQER